ncbi:haloacid dehalogenase-like hydrolase [Streptomyces sp. XM4193]|uniref:HAD family hydrolase n=1 Tax=Streptomyces sp. XM4193 TaxID=2929782 RepID=UPI001FF9900C|nr:HAD family hydrolase [Streptomyces sp. XM4193]MCK1799153.1 haloacid dehalogenase-like hydrolase [Streptomyces sp. XM4193]
MDSSPPSTPPAPATEPLLPSESEAVGRGTHIVWDWNGTLLHDIHTVIEATNAAFTELDMPTITLDRYRELYCVPVPRFYERLTGRLPSAEEFAVLDSTFHRHYFARVADAGLAEGAAELLASRRSAGFTQSLCSLAPHEHLVPLVRGHRIHQHFVRIDGSDSSGPSAGKAEQMARHVRELLVEVRGLTPGRTVVIGDALDDARAAAHVGAHAVLYTGGSHSRRSLQEAGVPVVDSLAEAVETAERIAG